MGIDNDAKLIFGISMSYDDFRKMARVVGDDVDLIGLLYGEGDDAFSHRFPGLYVGYGSPYYDSDLDAWTCYIGIGSEQDEYSLDDLKTLLSTWETSGYRECLAVMDIEFQEPTVHAIPHVW